MKNSYNHAMFQMTEENLLEAECDTLVPAANEKNKSPLKIPTTSKHLRYSVTSSINFYLSNFWAVIWLSGFQAWLLASEKGYSSL